MLILPVWLTQTKHGVIARERPHRVACSSSISRRGRLSLRLPLRTGIRFLDRRVRCGQSRDRDAEGRAAHVVQADVVAELDGFRVAAVLAADAALEIAAHAAALLDGHADQLADAGRVDALEGIA